MKSVLTELLSSGPLWLESELERAPFCTAEYAESSGRLFFQYEDGSDVSPPTEAGIYLVYLKSSAIPFYAGEASNLNSRLRYHFSRSASAAKHSTLSKVARDHGYFNLPAYIREFVRFKWLSVPFGRKELELHCHKTYGINTKKKTKGGGGKGSSTLA